MQKEIHINYVDYTSYVTRYGYGVSYQKVQGAGGGTMLDGSTTEDVIAVKAIITVPLMPLMEDQLYEILREFRSVDYPVLYYFDPYTGDYREIETIMAEPQTQHVGMNAFNSEIWLAGTLTFTER